MSRKAKIFKPDHIKTQICKAVIRDIAPELHEYGDNSYDPLRLLMTRQMDEIDKKYVSTSTKDQALRDLAFSKFEKVNTHMSKFTKEGLNLPSEDMRYPQRRHGERNCILLRARALMSWILAPFDEDEWFRATKHGTGTSVGVSFMDTSLEAKSSLPMSVTERALPILQRYHSFDNQLKSAIIYHNDRTPIGEWYDIVEGSRATTVPKNSKIDRMIAVEPTGNMFLQQGLMNMMYDRMKDVGLDLETLPSHHKNRARNASITSKEATIDWSSASDCVSIELLRWLIPPMWFECCDMVRSETISLNGDQVSLSMFSTMGNAVTFPLETLVFWTLATAVRLQKQGTLSHFPEWKDRHLCSVFGDDCIVPSDIALDFIQIMESVGFIINDDKSFYGKERFRESCGGDYLRGIDVRPFYLKAPSSNRLSALEPWLYIIGNRLMSKYVMCFGKRNYLYHQEFWKCWLGLFRKYNFSLKIVPSDFPDDAGLKIASDFARFRANYPTTRLSKVVRSQHGELTFLFCSFKYTERVNRDNDLRYADWLKKFSKLAAPPNRWDDEDKLRYVRTFRKRTFRSELSRLGFANIPREPEVKFSTRKRGGYVVVKAKTVHWTVD